MGGQTSALLAESYNDWWSLSGVASLVGEDPAGWLVVPPANDAAAAKPKRAPDNEPVPFPLPAAIKRHQRQEAHEHKGAVVYPDQWYALHNWLATDSTLHGTPEHASRARQE